MLVELVAMFVVLLAMLVVLVDTCWLVACNCAPFTASVLPADSVPAFTPVSVRAPAVPVRFTDVPATSLPTVSTLLVASCSTRRGALARFAIAAAFDEVWTSNADTAAPTLV
ncbi:hypothetical protein D3C87_1551180 [compost metagenome]